MEWLRFVPRRAHAGLVVTLIAMGCGTGAGPKTVDAAVDGSLGDAGVDGSASPDGSVGDGGTASPIALADFCDVVRDDVCTVLMQCAGERYPSRAACVADHECGAMADLTAAVNAGGIVWDANVAGACQARFLASPCDYGFFFFIPTVDDILAACPEIYEAWPGRVPDGSACTMDLACGAHSFCKTNAACPGTCTPYLGEGETCASSGDCDERLGLDCVSTKCTRVYQNFDPCSTATDCGPGGECLVVGGFHVCSVGAHEGETCNGWGSTAPNCRLGLFCEANTAMYGSTGTCRSTPRADGETCLHDSDCADGLSCFVTDYVTTAIGTCRAPAGLGVACSDDNDCLSTLRCASNVCADKAAFGASCSYDAACAAGLACVGNRCVRMRGTGDACGPDDACVGAFCTAGTCVAEYPLGATCSAPNQCRSDDCSGSVCVDGDLCVNR